MVDRDEHRSLALTGEYGGQISAPHRVHGLRNDGAIMRSRSAWRTSAAGCQQPILAHQSQHPPPRGAYAAVSQPGPDLAMALAMERAVGQHGADRLAQQSIRYWPGWSTPERLRWGRRCLIAIDPRTGDPPDPADRCQTVGVAADWRNRPAHGLSLRRAKGRFASRMAIFSCNRSRSISASPSFAFSRSLASSSPLEGFAVSAASPAVRKASRQLLRVAAVTPRLRETVSRSSPRSSRSTAALLRCRDILPPRPGAAPPDSGGRCAPPGR